MAQGTLRRVTLAIAQESTPLTVSTGTKYIIPNVELSYDPQVMYAENSSMLGSDYEVSQVMNTIRQTSMTMKFKLDENLIPLILRNKFAISTSAWTGDTGVYDHTLTYKGGSSAGSGESYTLFWDDPDIGDCVVAGFRFNSTNFEYKPQEFSTVGIEGVGKYLAEQAVTNTVSATLREFVGRHTSIEVGDYGGAYATEYLYELAQNHSFETGGEDRNFYLGSQDMAVNLLKQSKFELSALVKYTDYSYRNDYEGNTQKKVKVTITDTARTIGSSSNPSVMFEYPRVAITKWAEEGGPNDIRAQRLTMLPLDDPSVANAPLVVTVRNTVSSYL